MEKFNKFCSISNIEELKKNDVALHFIWFHQRVKEMSNIDIKGINMYFKLAHLHEFPPSRLKDFLTKNSNVAKGEAQGYYKLTRKILDIFDKKYLDLITESKVSIKEKASLNDSPFLVSTDIDNAHKMAELYIIVHCYENSVRRFIEMILQKEIGNNWWDSVKNRELDEKFTTRKTKEEKARWIGSRGALSPLYYLDWTDLVKIFRKEESRFLPYINDLKFVEMRFEELERTRNVLAHNGILPSDDDFERLIIYFKDWCKQLKGIIIS